MRGWLIVFIVGCLSVNVNQVVAAVKKSPVNSRELYHEVGLDERVDYAVFDRAIQGYNQMDAGERDILTVIDYTKPSTQERLFVIDIRLKRLLFSSYVSHGKNSGENYATSFSNRQGSFKSSLGFFKTENTYNGKNGYSLILEGMERGINDKAKERAIVIHGAPYADPSTIYSSGRLGRSLGCPALPLSVSKQIIDVIKEGTILYIHGDDRNYVTQSKFIMDHNKKDLF